jgi:hypothetical protein
MRSRILTCVLLLALEGCESKRLLAGPPLHTLLYNIHVGMMWAEVIRQLGEPAQRYTLDEMEFLFYFTDWINTPKQSDRHRGWHGRRASLGKTYYEDFLKSRCRLKATAERQG